MHDGNHPVKKGKLVMWERAQAALLGPCVEQSRRDGILWPTVWLGFDSSGESSSILTRGKAECLGTDADRWKVLQGLSLLP